MKLGGGRAGEGGVHRAAAACRARLESMGTTLEEDREKLEARRERPGEDRYPVPREEEGDPAGVLADRYGRHDDGGVVIPSLLRVIVLLCYSASSRDAACRWSSTPFRRRLSARYPADDRSNHAFTARPRRAADSARRSRWRCAWAAPYPGSQAPSR